jgi:serine/threonine-protein kinase
MAQAGDVVAAKYRLIHPLGIGGMGAVWRCEHIQLKLQMAIKLLDARGPAADRAVQRFTREARIAASVRHRNIVTIMDFGTDGGAPYLVMELLRGVPLSERLIVAEPLSVAAFLRLIEQVLQGLRAVHDKGVIHRDLKPENIFLMRDEETLVPKLLDFGVSRSVERDKGHTITREGIVMGTPEYIAPEQARGKMPDARSDIYSLGVVMYEALGGVAPFHADNAADVIVAVLNAAPVPLESLRSDLDPKLTGLVSKAIAKKPEQRFQSAEEMRLGVIDLLRELPELERAYLPKRFVSHAPPERIALLTDPPSDLSADIEKPTVARPMTRSSRRARWTLLGLFLALLVAVALLMAERPRESAFASATPTPDAHDSARTLGAPQVSVELVGVPTNGRVLVDGSEIEGTLVRLTRGSGEHAIEVRAPGMKPWGVLFEASKDGRFEFVPERVEGDAIEPPQALSADVAVQDGGSPQPVLKPRAKSSGASASAKRAPPPKPTGPVEPKKSDGSSLLRTPDF